MVRPSGYYGRELGEGFAIGKSSSIGPYCYIGCSGYIEIGERVMLAPAVRMFAENHNFDDAVIAIKNQGVSRNGIQVEDDVWLASGVTVTAGVRIGRGAVIGAASVVTSDIPAMAVATGIPARVIRMRADSARAPIPSF